MYGQYPYIVRSAARRFFSTYNVRTLTVLIYIKEVEHVSRKQKNEPGAETAARPGIYQKAFTNFNKGETE
jgi:hypothetical protein